MEQLHRQLKTALKAQTNPNNWMESLPLVLLGIRTAIKEDIHCTTAELVYGTTLRLPADFFISSDDHATVDISDYVSRLKVIMNQLKATPTCVQASQHTFISKDLSSCTHVFVRQDSVRKPLQRPYNGPYKVLDRCEKYFVLDVKGKQDTVSLDRLKPAHLEVRPQNYSDSVDTLEPTVPLQSRAATERVSRSGRQLRWPDRLNL